MTCKATGQYYIGATSNYISRKKNHLISIQTLFLSVKLGIYEKPSLSCHLVIAKALVKGKRRSQLDKRLLEGVSFTILHKTKITEEANELETSLIQAGINDVLCLNILKKSSYTKKVFLVFK